MRNECCIEELALLNPTSPEPLQAEVQDQQREAKRREQNRFIEAGILRNSGFEQLLNSWENARGGLNELQGSYPPGNTRRSKENAYKGCAEEFADHRCALLLTPDVDKKSDEYKTLHELLRKWALNRLYSRDRELQDADAKKTAPPLTKDELEDLNKRIRTALNVAIAPEPAKPRPHEIAKPVTLTQDAINNIPDSLGTPEQVKRLRTLWQERQSNRISGMELQTLLAARADRKPLTDEELKLVRTHLLGSTLARIRNPVERNTFISTLKGTEYEALLKEANTLNQEQRSKAENLINAGEARRINSLRKGRK